MERTEARTARHTRLTLQVAFNYGGRAELVDAARRIASDAVAGRLSPPSPSANAAPAASANSEREAVDLWSPSISPAPPRTLTQYTWRIRMTLVDGPPPTGAGRLILTADRRLHIVWRVLLHIVSFLAIFLLSSLHSPGGWDRAAIRLAAGRH
ncbi:MAG: undecaprenyl diphosphate synthase family protein [Egibacteraceae bacterium]